MSRKEYTEAERAGARRLGEAVAAARGARHMSRNDVARAAVVSPEHLRLIEVGDAPGVGFLLMVRIANTLGLHLDQLARAGAPETKVSK